MAHNPLRLAVRPRLGTTHTNGDVMDFFLTSLLGLLSAVARLGLWVEVLFWIGFGVFLGWLTGAIRYLRNSRVGIVEKLWSASGARSSRA